MNLILVVLFFLLLLLLQIGRDEMFSIYIFDNFAESFPDINHNVVEPHRFVALEIYF